ncbi:hypothetical protein GCM10010429_47800 [Micromonospora olivasterospora]
MNAHLTPDKPALRSWLPGFVALAAIWGSSLLFINVGVRELHPLHLTLYRVTAGALTLLVVLLVLRDRLPREPRVWAHLFVVAPLVAGAPPAPARLSAGVLASVLALGALGTGLAFVINMRNIRVAGASTASTVTYLIPVFAVLIGALALDERLNWRPARRRAGRPGRGRRDAGPAGPAPGRRGRPGAAGRRTRRAPLTVRHLRGQSTGRPPALSRAPTPAAAPPARC